MKDLTAAVLVCLLLVPASVGAGKKKEPPPPPSLPSEHWNDVPDGGPSDPGRAGRSGVESGPPEVLETRGDGLIVRMLRREGEIGLDSLHVECMLVRLAGAMDTFPQVDYEYDFVGGEIGEPAGARLGLRRPLRRAGRGPPRLAAEELDGGRRGGVGVRRSPTPPSPVWKKSKPARNLLTSVVESIRF